jgi:ribose transport system ATP-binding protein
MKELLEQGVGILMLTPDYAEALEMSHRIVIMRQGKIASILDRGQASEADILRESIGAVRT